MVNKAVSQTEQSFDPSYCSETKLLVGVLVLMKKNKNDGGFLCSSQPS